MFNQLIPSICLQDTWRESYTQGFSTVAVWRCVNFNCQELISQPGLKPLLSDLCPLGLLAVPPPSAKGELGHPPFRQEAFESSPSCSSPSWILHLPPHLPGNTTCQMWMGLRKQAMESRA